MRARRWKTSRTAGARGPAQAPARHHAVGEDVEIEVRPFLAHLADRRSRIIAPVKRRGGSREGDRCPCRGHDAPGLVCRRHRLGIGTLSEIQIRQVRQHDRVAGEFAVNGLKRPDALRLVRLALGLDERKIDPGDLMRGLDREDMLQGGFGLTPLAFEAVVGGHLVKDIGIERRRGPWQEPRALRSPDAAQRRPSPG